MILGYSELASFDQHELILSQRSSGSLPASQILSEPADSIDSADQLLSMKMGVKILVTPILQNELSKYLIWLRAKDEL